MTAMTRRTAWVVASFLALAIPAELPAHEGSAPASDFHAAASDGPPYPVSGFRFEIASSTPDASELRALPELRVVLGQVQDGFVAPGGPAPETEVPLVVAPYTNYYASALQAITLQIADHLKDEGFESVIVYPVEQEIDPETGADLRGVGQLNLHLLVRAEPGSSGWFD